MTIVTLLIISADFKYITNADLIKREKMAEIPIDNDKIIIKISLGEKMPIFETIRKDVIYR